MNFSFTKVHQKNTVMITSNTKKEINTTVMSFRIHAAIAYTTNLSVANPAFRIATDFALPIETCKY